MNSLGVFPGCRKATGGVLLAAICSGAVSGPSLAEEVTFLGEPVPDAAILQGEALYGEYCADCHGVNREGAPNWRRRLESGRMPAPPQDGTGHSFTHSDPDLFAMTKLGIDAVVPGYESDMPAFDGVLTDSDIVAILGFVKKHWPEDKGAIQAGLPGMAAFR